MKRYIIDYSWGSAVIEEDGNGQKKIVVKCPTHKEAEEYIEEN